MKQKLSWLRRWRQRPHEVSEAPEVRIALSPALREFVDAVTTAATDDDPRFGAAIEQLRRDPDTHVAEIAAVFDQLGDAHLALRHCLLMAAAAIRHPASVDLMRDAALRPLPALSPERGDGPPPCVATRATTAAEALRAQAVDGLDQLATAGEPSAIDALVRCVAEGSLTVRALALTALGTIGGAEEARAAAIEHLDRRDRDLADLRRVGVDEVDQIRDPRRHLARDEREHRPPPDPSGRDPWPGDDRSTPRAGRSIDHG